MGNIVLLDDLTINKIAAGEVIERPASVIKEMVENSIDAGANNITVEIKNGGISFIKVTDNGKGMPEDDMEIAFERHATSKIRCAEDLNVVTSMGFRGEALASIAAIANVEMVSKTAEQFTGFKVIVEAGNVLSKEEVACPTGTSITVRNLFFNTPVRYKFLKKDYTESGYIEDVITRIALVNPDIAIKLINTGKTVIQTNGNGDIKSVIYSIYGKDVASGIVPVNYTFEDITVSGVVGKPDIARSNRSNQLFFVNKRYVKDKTLSAATEQAFKGLIQLGKFGFVILNIDMNPSKVDVNVHPAKLEVRFEDEGTIFQAIYHAIKDTLLKNEISPIKEEEKEEKIDILKEIEKFAIPQAARKQEETIKENKAEIKAQKPINFGQGGPVNTADVLEQLRKMQEDIQKQADEDPSIKLNQNYIEMRNREQIEDTDNQIVEKAEEIKENKIEEQNEINEVAEEAHKEEKEVSVEEINNEQEVFEKDEKQEETENNNIEDNIVVEQDNVAEKIENEPLDGETIIISTEEIQEKYKIKEEQEIEEQQDRVAEKDENYLPNVENYFGNASLNEGEEKPDLSYVEEPKLDFDEMYAKLFGKKPLIDNNEKIEENNDSAVDIVKDNVSIFEEVEEYKKPVYKFIGIIFDIYIIIEIDKEMYIINQSSANERIMYEKIKQNYYNNSKDSQSLLLPDVINLSNKEMGILKENIDLFKKAGFALEEFGENTMKLTAVPTICLEADNKGLILETVDEIDSFAKTETKEKEEKFISIIAHKASIKDDVELSKEDAEKLIDELLQLQEPFVYPNGRQVSVKMAKYDIERKFARK